MLILRSHFAFEIIMPQNIYERVKEISEFRETVLKLEALRQYSCKEKSAGKSFLQSQKRSITSTDPEVWFRSSAGRLNVIGRRNFPGAEAEGKSPALYSFLQWGLCWVTGWLVSVLASFVLGCDFSQSQVRELHLVWSISVYVWGFWYDLIFSGIFFISFNTLPACASQYVGRWLLLPCVTKT